MTRRRWIADEVEGDRAFLLGQNAHHLARVLRARVGQEYAIACPGAVRLGRIVEVSDERIAFALAETLSSPETRPITLLLSVFKFDRMEWAIEKATELGVACIQPVIAQRTDAHLATAAGKRVERWRRIAHEAAQQSRRATPPEIADPISLKDALCQQSLPGLVLAESEQQLLLTDALSQRDHSEEKIALAIGPEGGWTAPELQAFAEAHWKAVSLGPTILRAETAAIAAVVIAAAFPQK